MTPFLAAQVADPFDPVPMLILADHLEEQGDQVGAAVLRALDAAGIHSIQNLAWITGCVDPVHHPDCFLADRSPPALGPGCGSGDGDGFGWAHGYGDGDAFGKIERGPDGRIIDGIGRGLAEQIGANAGGSGTGESERDHTDW